MNVLHITNDYPYKALYANLMNHLRTADISCQVFVPLWHGSKQHVEDPNVLVDECFGKIERYMLFVKERKTAESIERQYVLENIDLVHAHRLFSTGYAAYTLWKKYDIPYIVAVRNADVNLFFKKLFFLRGTGVEIMRHASKIIFLSYPYLEDVLTTYVPEDEQEAFRKKSMVIPNGIDDFYLQNEGFPKKLGEDPAHILYVGEVNKNKNIVSVIKAIEMLNADGTPADYTVVGPVLDKSLKPYLEGNSVVHYHDPCPKEQVIRYMNEADILVMPSFNETFGLVYAEALSQGLPVIYSKGQGFDGQFEDGYIGYAVNPASVEDIARGIRQVISNYSDISQRTISAARRFSWDNVAVEYKQIYQEAISENSKVVQE